MNDWVHVISKTVTNNNDQSHMTLVEPDLLKTKQDDDMIQEESLDELASISANFFLSSAFLTSSLIMHIFNESVSSISDCMLA